MHKGEKKSDHMGNSATIYTRCSLSPLRGDGPMGFSKGFGRQGLPEPRSEAELGTTL